MLEMMNELIQTHATASWAVPVVFLLAALDGIVPPLPAESGSSRSPRCRQSRKVPTHCGWALVLPLAPSPVTTSRTSWAGVSA